ncbi:hypothetical protein RUM44_009582 [Polyplax serrata]|uniref:Uncharacterized protein n=1 Tax=Polyplax serrata TaxID=468196 RepID=A0ABR1AT37_POLSC
MPTPTSAKFRGPLVRQHSLQNTSRIQSPGSHRLKKQLSEDDGRILDAVEITGQGWPSSARHSVLGLGCGEGNVGHVKVASARPKPAKVAWIDKKQDSLETPLDVEVVAKKCQGQPRPVSIKAQRFRNPLIGNKDTLVYTRLQLAARLRNAWSERDKTKPNINIFLAHASDTTRSDNSPSDIPDNASVLSDTVEKKRRPLQMRAFSQDYCPPDMRQCDGKQEESLSKEEENEVLFTGAMPGGEENIADEIPGEETSRQNKIEIRVTTNEDYSIEQSSNKENLEILNENGSEGETYMPMVVRPVVLTAKDRRANFRSSSMHHKTITESFSLPNDDEKSGEDSDEAKKQNSKKVLVRAFSAPNHDGNYPKTNAQQKTVKFLPQKRLQSVATYEFAGDTSQDDLTVQRERLKSVSARRKLKSAAPRRKNKDKADSSSEDELRAKESTEKSTRKSTRKVRGKNGHEIVTMVSLVSPAGSDTEDSVLNLPMGPLLAKDVSLETKAEVKASCESDVRGTTSTFVSQKFVCLRKTPKTVTFQTNPVLTRNYSSSFPSRRAPAGTPIIIPTPINSNHPALTPAQLQERDKRPPIFAGTDGRAVKRRLIRSPSEPVKEEESYVDKAKPRRDSLVYDDDDNNDFRQISEALGRKENDEVRPEDGEPQFKCPKEKECWALYKKMVAKGVSVTFDTVLRGMLTPTEYRLKKNRLLSTG